MAVEYVEVQGEGFKEVAPKLLQEARDRGCIVATRVNGVVVYVHPNESLNRVVASHSNYLRDRIEYLQEFERRRNSSDRRHTIHEESPGRRLSDTSIPIVTEPSE